MRLAAPMILCALSSSALANPCGAKPPTQMKTVESWPAVYAHLNNGKKTAANIAEATKYLCAAKDAGRPCDPSAPISVVYDHWDSTVALAFKNPTGTYAVLTLPIDLSPNVHNLAVRTLPDGLMHINANWEEFGREMFCEPEDLDKDGVCRDGMSATISLGHTYVDLMVDPASRAVLWSKGCALNEEASKRATTVIREPDGSLGYVDCTPLHDPQWFSLKGDQCAPIKPPVDIATVLRVARRAAKAGDYKTAVSTFDSVLRYAPGRPDYLSERGYLRYKAGELDGAVSDLEAARKTHPDRKLRGIIEFNLGLVKEARGDALGAMLAYQSANHLRPSKAAKAKIAEMKAKQGK